MCTAHRSSAERKLRRLQEQMEVCSVSGTRVKLTSVGFEPTPLRNGALSHRLRPLGQNVHETTVAGEHDSVISSPDAGVKSDIDPASELAHGALHTSSVDPQAISRKRSRFF